MNKPLMFLRGDFETAWDAIASLDGDIPRGNLTFATLIPILLTLAGVPEVKLITPLRAIDPRYVEHCDGQPGAPCVWLDLFGYLDDPGWVYDESHASIGIDNLDVAITGAAYGRSISESVRKRSADHLTVKDGKLVIRPEQLYIDVVRALAALGGEPDPFEKQ